MAIPPDPASREGSFDLPLGPGPTPSFIWHARGTDKALLVSSLGPNTPLPNGVPSGSDARSEHEILRRASSVAQVYWQVCYKKGAALASNGHLAREGDDVQEASYRNMGRASEEAAEAPHFSEVHYTS